MSSCPFAAPGRQVACLSLQKQRSEMMTREYDRNECFSCPMRRKRLEGAEPPERIAIPAGNIGGGTAKPTSAGRVTWDPVQARFGEVKPPIEKNPPREETGVIDDKARERVLSRILREKVCSKSQLMNYCAVAKDELTEIVSALVTEGKIKAWPKGRGAIYTPPDAEDPTGSPAQIGTASGGQKPTVARKLEIQKARKTVASGAAKPAPSNGSGAVADMIADLETLKSEIDAGVAAKKAKIDSAIEALRALA